MTVVVNSRDTLSNDRSVFQKLVKVIRLPDRASPTTWSTSSKMSIRRDRQINGTNTYTYCRKVRRHANSAAIRLSKPSLLIGISGVWNGFFMTASAYISYTFCKTESAVGSTSDVSRTNFVPVGGCVSERPRRSNRCHTSSGQKNVHLERFARDDMGTGAGAYGGETAGDCMDTVERAGEDEVLV